MYIINIRPGDAMEIGRRGEHNARQVSFDLRDWMAHYGAEGRAELIFQRPGDSAPYPVAIAREGSSAVWTITATDTEKAGSGRAELRYYMGDTLAKSAASSITVSDAMEEPGKIPDPPGQSWLDQALDAARRAEHAADRAEGGGGSGGSGADGTDGEDGGYYTPKVSQPSAATMLVEHTPSKAGMPAVEPVTINLPVGSGSSRNLNPVTKTDDMTQAVGVDGNGLLWTAPTAGNSGSDSGSGGTTVTENVVGATPFEVTKDGLYIRPEVTTRVYNVSDGVENLMEQFQTVKTYADQIVYGTTSKTVIEAQSKVEGANPPVIAHVYGYAAEPGDYTLLITSATNTFIRIKKRTGTSNLNMEPGTNVAQGYTNSIVNFTVTEADVASYPCNIGVQITATSAVLPDTFTMKLVKGKYDAIPDGVSLEFQVEAGQKFSLNPFKGITAYADPVANVYEAVESESGSTGSTETTSGTLLCFGDSLTAARYSMYPEMLTEMGMNAINFGVSGMQLRAVDSPYCMCSIVDALKAGDMTAQIEGGENANYANLLSLMPAATGIVIWYGTNDYNGDCVFEGEGTNTIEGALRYVLTELFTLYPKKAIYVVSPFLYTYAYGHQPENPNGTVAEMIEVMRGVCEEFAVPFIDMSRESGFNQITRLTLTSDQLHPDTTAGRERLAKFMYGKLRSLGC